MYRQPLAGPQRHLDIRSKVVLRFNDVDVLNAQTIARSKNSAGVVLVIDVLQNDCQLTCPELHDIVKALQTVVSQTLLQIFGKGLRHRFAVMRPSELFPTQWPRQDGEETGPATEMES